MASPAEEACIVFYGTRIWLSLSDEQMSEAIDKMEDAVDAYERALDRLDVFRSALADPVVCRIVEDG